MKYLRIFILLKLIFIFQSCGTIKEGFTNQKKNSSDEFLVEKKSPLVMPPEYNDLPIPKKNKNQSNNNEENKIKKLISSEDINTKKPEDINQNFEKTLIEKIKKD